MNKTSKQSTEAGRTEMLDFLADLSRLFGFYMKQVDNGFDDMYGLLLKPPAATGESSFWFYRAISGEVSATTLSLNWFGRTESFSATHTGSLAPDTQIYSELCAYLQAQVDARLKQAAPVT